MKIAFLDGSDWDYTPLTPYERPIGGSQSAACYLAAALAANGHEVALVNNTATPGNYAGVACPGLAEGRRSDYLNGFDAVVALGAAVGRRLRLDGIRSRLVLWTGHAADQRVVAALKTAEERMAWDRLALVSEWQAKAFREAFGIEAQNIAVLRNAIAPPFEGLSRRGLPFFQREDGPLLVYTSTPFRGLEVLLTAFPMIRAALPGCRLKVYSGMEIYQLPPERDDFRVLYELCRVLPGAEYVGPLSQKALAAALSEADILAYSNTFPETSCIAVMEAMAAGCLVVSSRLGALPETTAGFAVLRDVPQHPALHAKAYAELVIDVVKRGRERASVAEMQFNAQIAHARSVFTWAARAREWEAALAQVVGG